MAALKEIERASLDTLQNDTSSSGNALATVHGAAANQFVYFTAEVTTAFATVSDFILTLLDDASAATARTTLGLGTAATHAAGDFAGTTQAAFVSGIIKAPANQDYRIVEYIPYGLTVTRFTVKTASGTCTAALKVNSTTVTGGSLSASSTQSTAAISTGNTAVASDAMVLTVSANSNAVDLSFTAQFTWTLT